MIVVESVVENEDGSADVVMTIPKEYFKYLLEEGFNSVVLKYAESVVLKGAKEVLNDPTD